MKVATSSNTVVEGSAQTDQKYFRPEWIRVEDAVRRFGLSRSRLYQLIGQKRIKSFSLRERNQIKGTRLLNYDSLCEFFEREAQGEQEVNTP
jgi:hypothetical protein